MLYGHRSFTEYKSKEDTIILSEVYFGKNEDMERLEKSVINMRKVARKKRFDMRSTDPSVEEFCTTVEDIFGFETVGVSIKATNEVNAACYPIGQRIGKGYSEKIIKDNLIADEKTFKFRKEAHFSVLFIINLGLLMDERFTDSEVTAVLIHEIGHNFSDCFNPNKVEVRGFMTFNILGILLSGYIQALDFVKAKIKAFDLINQYDIDIEDPKTDRDKKFVNALNSINKGLRKTITDYLTSAVATAVFNSSKFVDKAIQLTKTKEKNKFGIGFFLRTFNISWEIYTNIKEFISLRPTSIAKIFDPVQKFIDRTSLYQYAFTMPARGKSYKDEKLADKFVAVYGYGPELSSYLKKIEFNSATGIKVRDIVTSTPILGLYYNITNMPGMLIVDLLSTHPNSVNRVKSTIDTLEKELQRTDLRKKQKDVIQSNIDESRKILDQMITITSNPFTDTFIGKKIYYGILYHLCGGDIRDIVLNIKDDDMDTIYDDAMERNKKHP